jgi:hypothetical protein
MIVSRRTIGALNAPLELVLEHHGRLTVGDAIRQGGDRKLPPVEPILPACIGRGCPSSLGTSNSPVSSSGMSHSSIPLTLSRRKIQMIALPSASFASRLPGHFQWGHATMGVETAVGLLCPSARSFLQWATPRWAWKASSYLPG